MVTHHKPEIMGKSESGSRRKHEVEAGVEVGGVVGAGTCLANWCVCAVSGLM